jgi:hypothetical protein
MIITVIFCDNKILLSVRIKTITNSFLKIEGGET